MQRFKDGPTVSGPLEAFLQPGSKVSFMRGKEICEGTCTVERVDVKTKTIYFTALPNGIKPGDRLIK